MGEMRDISKYDEKSRLSLLASTGLKPVYGESVGYFEDDVLVATATKDGQVIKGVAIDEKSRGEGLLNIIIGELHKRIRKDYDSSFIFTKPQNKELFSSLGYYPLYENDKCLFLESRKDGIEKWASSLNLGLPTNKVLEKGRALIVMNANPFTLGHRYLVEKAAKEEEELLVFVVSEDASFVSFEDRFALVKEGLKDLENVKVFSAPKYMISKATFPSYFLKDEITVNEAYVDLDSGLFAKVLAPLLLVKRRYVGTEPKDEITLSYNKSLAQRCQEEGLSLIEIPRLEKDGKVVSASLVRELLNNGNWTLAESLVPSSTYQWLWINGVANRAIWALESELKTTIKPGLVDMKNSGAHSDMDYRTFEKSIEALKKPFVKMAGSSSFEQLRFYGMEAEKAMFEATKGINTHKGAIFTLGLIMFASVQTKSLDPDVVLEFVKKTVKGISKELTCEGK
ncbi:MAG: triphosphoribosyl-dephospho-CoA synthase, partial [Sphaerochaetaceae bacterium]|nr:triphosphoribosyl-dephospho-CoA synthase [Sphaerochaetaceae bacterium]